MRWMNQIDEIRMSNDELMMKREMARGKQGAAVASPPSLGLRRGKRLYICGPFIRVNPT